MANLPSVFSHTLIGLAQKPKADVASAKQEGQNVPLEIG